jgi:drug/metabolite transporter (DMT)-like permease
MLALATAECLWGTGFYFGKIALTEMPVASMVLFRFAFACAGLLPIIFFHRPHFAGSEWGWVLAASVLGVPVQYLVQFIRTIPHHGVARLFNGRHTSNAFTNFVSGMTMTV